MGFKGTSEAMLLLERTSSTDYSKHKSKGDPAGVVRVMMSKLSRMHKKAECYTQERQGTGKTQRKTHGKASPVSVLG